MKYILKATIFSFLIMSSCALNAQDEPPQTEQPQPPQADAAKQGDDPILAEFVKRGDQCAKCVNNCPDKYDCKSTCLQSCRTSSGCKDDYSIFKLNNKLTICRDAHDNCIDCGNKCFGKYVGTTGGGPGDVLAALLTGGLSMAVSGEPGKCIWNQTEAQNCVNACRAGACKGIENDIRETIPQPCDQVQ